MKRLLKLGLVVGVACIILSGCGSSNNLQKNDVIVFLGDSITAAGVNPDGYEYNRLTNPNGGGLWRKNRRPHEKNSYGVDLNRNYAWGWKH